MSSMGKKKIILIALSLVFITFFVYLPALQNGFVNWDDPEYVYENRNIQKINFRFLEWTLSAVVAALWHPLTLFSLAIDYAFWGHNPVGYHLTNNIFHTLNTLLVFILVMKIFSLHEALRTIEKGRQISNSNMPIISAFVTALLFGIHPLHVESIAWVSERKDLLCAFFFLLTLLAYLGYAAADTKRKKVGYYLLCLVLFIFALMSKPMAVSLPMVLLILDFFPLGRLTKKEKLWNLREIAIEKVPFFLLSLFASLSTIWAHQAHKLLQGQDAFPFKLRIFNAIQAFIFYLVKMALPFNLAPYYPFPVKINSFIFPLLALLAITLFSLLILKRSKLFFSVWLYYIITLIPVIGIIKVGGHAMADRYMYLPSIGPFLLVGLGIGTMLERSKKLYRILIFVVLAFLSALLIDKTLKQIAVWRDSVTLWSYQVKIFPQTALAYVNRGIAFSNTGSYYEAIKDYTTAVKLSLQDWSAYYNRGIAYRGLGDNEKAIKDYTAAIKLNPQNENIYYNRGIAYGNLGNYEKAIEDYTAAIKLNPQDVRPYNNRATAYSILGSFQQAIADLKKAISLKPEDGRPYFNLGLVYLQTGDTESAKVYLNKAASLGLEQAKGYNQIFTIKK